ncbi:hypothetical protein EVAR_99038_1 [Eumeta japonica]|uniref:Uncharacterized protein n=1 Tax=Eumeta variegata TaxID=151549 RepID=A0A4C1Y0P1_EUMVA|nr:hypothetical protein EVAR_99038_1 [Eumeta japonica]
MLRGTTGRPRRRPRTRGPTGTLEPVTDRRRRNSAEQRQLRVEKKKRYAQSNAFHPGRINAPTVSEVVAVFVTNDGTPPSNIDFVMYSKRTGVLSKISYLNPHSDPMCYPLLFPCGDSGWTVAIQSSLATSIFVIGFKAAHSRAPVSTASVLLGDARDMTSHLYCANSAAKC